MNLEAMMKRRDVIEHIMSVWVHPEHSRWYKEHNLLDYEIEQELRR